MSLNPFEPALYLFSGKRQDQRLRRGFGKLMGVFCVTNGVESLYYKYKLSFSFFI